MVRPSAVNQMAASGVTGKLVTRGIVRVGAVVATLTNTLAESMPLRVTEVGDTMHVANDGAPPQATETV